MQDCQNKIKENNDGISSGKFSAYQMFVAKKKIKQMNEKFDRLVEKYDECI